MDGVEATRQLRDWERSRCTDGYHQLIIGGSANDDEETLRDARNAGMDDFIPKPFNLKALKLRIQSLRAAP
jgi:CheY-like chemotaxis protein